MRDTDNGVFSFFLSAGSTLVAVLERVGKEGAGVGLMLVVTGAAAVVTGMGNGICASPAGIPGIAGKLGIVGTFGIMGNEFIPGKPTRPGSADNKLGGMLTGIAAVEGSY